MCVTRASLSLDGSSHHIENLDKFHMCQNSYSTSVHAYCSLCSFSLANSCTYCCVTDSTCHSSAPASTYGHTHARTQGRSSPLLIASSKGYDGIVEMLLQAGATVDLQDKVEDCYYMIELCSSVTCSVPLAVFIVH